MRKLHIGGKIKSPGWEILNTLPAPEVDHVCNANNLKQFENQTFTEIYATHIAEHLDYTGEIQTTLIGWSRVMKVGAKLYISVPDLDILSGLMLLKEELSFDERFLIMRMMFGGHIDKYDYHVVGLNEEFLHRFLSNAGFVNIQRVENFGLFEDTSSMLFRDIPISLNMTAEKS